MLDTLLITFREGLEAFLIVAITLAYLAKTGRKELAPAVYVGVVAALAISAITGYKIGEETDENPGLEGILSMISGLLVASMTYYVMKTSKNIRNEINTKIERHAVKSRIWAILGLFGFTVLMIAREGIETAIMLGTLSASSDAATLLTGGLLGLLSAACIGVIWVKQSHRINLRLFLQVTGIFLILFSIRLFIYGIHELAENAMLPFVDNGPIHLATEPFGHDGLPAQIISYSLLVVPCFWIGLSWLRQGKSLQQNLSSNAGTQAQPQAAE